MNLCSREEAEILPFHGYEKEEMIRDRGKKRNKEEKKFGRANATKVRSSLRIPRG